MNVIVCTGNNGKLAEFEAAFGGVPVSGLGEVERRCGVPYGEPPEEADLFLANALTKILHATRWLLRSAAAARVEPGALAGALLVDDSGLCVPALGFEPGVHSATYGGLPRDDARNRAVLREALARKGLARAPAFFVCYLVSLDTAALAARPGDRAVAPVRAFVEDDVLPSTDSDVVRTAERGTHLPSAAASCAAMEPSGGTGFTRPFEDLVPALKASALGAVPVHVAFGFCAGEVAIEEQVLIPGVGHGYDALFYPVSSPRLSFASVPTEDKIAVSHRAAALRAFLTARASRA